MWVFTLKASKRLACVRPARLGLLASRPRRVRYLRPLRVFMSTNAPKRPEIPDATCLYACTVSPLHCRICALRTDATGPAIDRSERASGNVAPRTLQQGRERAHTREELAPACSWRRGSGTEHVKSTLPRLVGRSHQEFSRAPSVHLLPSRTDRTDGAAPATGARAEQATTTTHLPCCGARAEQNGTGPLRRCACHIT
ncbi:hypothetical protein SEVIR_1G174501v4 [Setaria viridis]